MALIALVFIPGLPGPSPGPNRPPSPPVIGGPSSLTVEIGVNVTFTASTYDPEIYDTLYWTWIWGDGATSSTIGTTPDQVSAYGHAWTSVGTYFVNVTVADSWSPPIPCANPVSVVVVPPPPGALKGVVLATDLTPIGGAEVTVSPSGHTATTDESGGYVLTLSPGTYSVTASAFGFGTDTKAGRAVVSQGTTTVDFTLTPILGTVSGTVRSAAGTPLTDATIVITPTVGRGTAVVYTVGADSRGSFSQALPFGTYLVTVAAPGFLRQNRSGVIVAPGGSVTLDFNMAPESSSSSTLSLPVILAAGGVVFIAGFAAFLLMRRRKSA